MRQRLDELNSRVNSIFFNPIPAEGDRPQLNTIQEAIEYLLGNPVVSPTNPTLTQLQDAITLTDNTILKD